MRTPSINATRAMLRACDSYFTQLVDSGCTESVALDRTWDVYEAAYEGIDREPVDPRDKLFSNKLRTIAQKGR